MPDVEPSCYAVAMRALIAMLVLVAGCDVDDSEPDVLAPSGTWQFSSAECNGQPQLFPGYSSEYRIAPPMAQRTIATADCVIDLDAIPILDGNRINEGLAGGVACDPDPCALTVGGATVQCPADYPIAGNVITVVSADFNKFTALDATGCTSEWVRGQ